MAVSQEDLNNLAWTMLGEAKPGDTEGMTAVGNTVLNREASGKYGHSITSIVKAPNQYAAWGIGSQAANQNQHMQEKYPVGSQQFQQALQIAQGLVTGTIPDNTYGSTDYRAASAGTSWANGRKTVNIGGNVYALPPNASLPRNSDTPQLAYNGSPTAVQSDGLTQIDKAMGTYANQNTPPLPQPRPNPPNVFAPGSVAATGGVGAGTGAGAGAILRPSAGFDPVGPGPGSFNFLAPNVGGGGNTQYVTPSGSVSSPQLAGTVAMPPGARPANIDQMFASMPGQNQEDPGSGPNWGELQREIAAGNYLSPSTTYTQAQMQTANPAYLAYINAQKADPIGQGPGTFADLQRQTNALAPGAPAPTISTSHTVVSAPSDAVKNIQLALQQGGYSPGGVDGYYGPNTTAAVKAFQLANGLSPDGIVGMNTLTKMQQLALPAVNRPAPTPAPAAPPPPTATQNFLSNRGYSTSGVNALAPVQANNFNDSMGWNGGHGSGSFGI